MRFPHKEALYQVFSTFVNFLHFTFAMWLQRNMNCDSKLHSVAADCVCSAFSLLEVSQIVCEFCDWLLNRTGNGVNANLSLQKLYHLFADLCFESDELLLH